MKQIQLLDLGNKDYKATWEYQEELFKKIVTKQDLGPLNAMLVMLDKIGDGSVSQHEASVIIGQRLVDRFVKPQLSGHAQGTLGR